jgi:hypothetical protein
MSKIGVSLKIDVSKIDKARLFQGAKGVYLDATVFIDVDQLDQYGNSGMITHHNSKEVFSRRLTHRQQADLISSNRRKSGRNNKPR